MQPKLKMRLGDLLVHEKVISSEQLQQALSSQKETGRKLGHTLVDLNMVTEDRLLSFLAQQLNVPLIDISQKQLSTHTVKLLPEVQARRFRALVLEDLGDKLLVGMGDPADLAALDAISNILPKPVTVAVVKEAQLLNAYDNVYRRTDDIVAFAKELGEETSDEGDFEFITGATGEQDTAVARLLQSIFEDAVQTKASDIHIET